MNVRLPSCRLWFRIVGLNWQRGHPRDAAETLRGRPSVRLKMEAQLTNKSEVERHYASAGITARVLTALRNVNGPGVPITPNTLAPIDHFHGRGVIATEELAAVL